MLSDTVISTIAERALVLDKSRFNAVTAMENSSHRQISVGPAVSNLRQIASIYIALGENINTEHDPVTNSCLSIVHLSRSAISGDS